jgi:Flp pilus assembly protein TadG
MTRRESRCRNASTRRDGVVATELALVVPLLLLLGIASADFGRMPHFQQIISNAARTAADTGATRQFTNFTRAAWEADIRRAAVEELANMPGFDESKLEYSLSTTTDGDGVTLLTVTVAIPFRTVCQWPGLPSNVMLHARVEARQFR